MGKSTTKILRELKGCSDFNKFYSENNDNLIVLPLSEMLCKLVKEKNIKKSQAIKASELSEVYGYQIFSGLRVPERNKLLCLAVGMGLNLEEVQTLLRCAGYSPLYVKLPFDSVVVYGICKKMSVMDINRLLFDYDMETLC